MKILSIFPIYIILFYLINFFFIKKKILLDNHRSSSHKTFLGKKNVPLSGGILFFTLIIFYFENLFFLDIVFYFVILATGLLSDDNRLTSATKRLVLQAFAVILYIYLSELYINETRLMFLDDLLDNNLSLKILFTSICILILMNGFNFIDGTNTLAAGYASIVLLGLLMFLFDNSSEYEIRNIQYLLSFLIIFLFFNFFSKAFLGDGGSYLISTVLGIICIRLAIHFEYVISPFFIALLLWYPALENLFSIVRRVIYQKKNANLADNYHLHHLIFQYINKKFNNKAFINPLTGIIINLGIFIFIYFATIFANQTSVLIALIVLKSFIYTITYFWLLNTKKNYN